MDSVIALRLDAWTTEWLAKKQGQVVVSPEEVVSADGKTLTALSDESGWPMIWTIVPDKQ